jgi:hypothetical protein
MTHLRQSVAEQRMVAASVRAIDANVRLRLRACALSEAIEETTAPHGVPITGLSEEDSMVTAIADARGVVAPTVNGAAVVSASKR